MIDLTDDYVISARAQLAQSLADLVTADSRVRRYVRLGFADDGGAVVVVELHAGPDVIAAEVIARELEFTAVSEIPQLSWVRVQLA